MQMENQESNDSDISQPCSVCKSSYYDSHIFVGLVCNSCNIKVHKYCYQPNHKAIQKFSCDQCRLNTIAVCQICDSQDDIKKHIQNNRFGHVLCLLTSNKIQIQSYGSLDFYFNQQITKEMMHKPCFYCLKDTQWKCLNQDQCQTYIHPYCFHEILQQFEKNKQLIESDNAILDNLLSKVEMFVQYKELKNLLNNISKPTKQMSCVSQLYYSNQQEQDPETMQNFQTCYIQKFNKIKINNGIIKNEKIILKMPEIMYNLYQFQKSQQISLQQQQNKIELLNKLSFNFSQKIKKQILPHINIVKLSIFLLRNQLLKYKQQLQKIIINKVCKKIIIFQYKQYIIQILHFICYCTMSKTNYKNIINKLDYLDNLYVQYQIKSKINKFKKCAYVQYDHIFVKFIAFMKKQEQNKIVLAKLKSKIYNYLNQINNNNIKVNTDKIIEVMMMIKKEGLQKQLQNSYFIRQSWTQLLCFSLLDEDGMQNILFNIYYINQFRYITDVNIIKQKKWLIKLLSSSHYFQLILQRKLFGLLSKQVYIQTQSIQLKFKLLVSNNILFLCKKSTIIIKQQQLPQKNNLNNQLQNIQQDKIIEQNHILQFLKKQCQERLIYLYDFVSKWKYLEIKSINYQKILTFMSYFATYKIKLTNKQRQIYLFFAKNVIRAFQQKKQKIKIKIIIKLMKIRQYFQFNIVMYKKQALYYKKWKDQFKKIPNVQQLLQRKTSAQNLFIFLCRKEQQTFQFQTIDFHDELKLIKMIKNWALLSIKLLGQVQPTLQSIYHIYKIIKRIKYPNNSIKKWVQRQLSNSIKIQKKLKKMLSKCLLKRQFQPEQQLNYIVSNHLTYQQAEQLIIDLQTSKLNTYIQINQVKQLIKMFNTFPKELSSLFHLKWSQKLNLQRLRKIISYHPIIYDPLDSYFKYLQKLFQIKQEKKKKNIVQKQIKPDNYFYYNKINILRIFSQAENQLSKIRKNKLKFLPWKQCDLDHLNLQEEIQNKINSWFKKLKILQQQVQNIYNDKIKKPIQYFQSIVNKIKYIPIRSQILQKFQRQILYFKKWEKILINCMKSQFFFDSQSPKIMKILLKIKKLQFYSKVVLDFQKCIALKKYFNSIPKKTKLKQYNKNIERLMVFNNLWGQECTSSIRFNYFNKIINYLIPMNSLSLLQLELIENEGRNLMILLPSKKNILENQIRDIANKRLSLTK